jgi:hypothetical protein
MDDPRDEDRPGDFRGVLLRVMIVQVVALLLLWLLQVRYTAG